MLYIIYELYNMIMIIRSFRPGWKHNQLLSKHFQGKEMEYALSLTFQNL